jgi:transcriptional regulator with XRE-family HTH domain
MKGKPLQKRIGDAIRKRREARDISQEAFADQIPMHRTYYGALERGEKNLQLSTLERVCKSLEVEMWEVIRDAERGE